MPANPDAAQVEASCHNRARSCDPVTKEGKAALAPIGNLQHGLIADTLVLPGDATQTPTEVLIGENTRRRRAKPPSARPARCEAAAFNQFIRKHRNLLKRPTLELALDQPEQVELPSEPEKGSGTHS